MLKKIAISVILALWTSTIAAQSDTLRLQYDQAEQFYDIGRTNDALRLLEKNIDRFSPELKVSALRLCALCYLASYDEDNALNYAKKLLEEKPGYASMQDPSRFKELIEELQNGRDVTITTASSSSETLEEAPVPVTLITEEMIKACGAQTVQDALIAYVPGISVIENNGVMSFAYRGIYGASQEKMLIMLNGVRFNSYASNLGLVDYSISIEKIKQIEVLRGPASSLYGDVALTGVVNIITKSGRDVDGVEINAGAGNYGQAKGGVLFGKHLYDFDILSWGAIYRSDGEKGKGVVANDTASESYSDDYTYADNILIGSFNHNPSYDFGISLKYKDLSLLYMCNSSKTVNPQIKDEQEYYFAPYSYWQYKSIHGNMPGAAYTTRNAKAAYDKNIGHWDISASFSFNREKMSKYFVTFEGRRNDSLFQSANFTEWEDLCYTASARISYNYGSKQNGGTIVLGADMSTFKMLYTNTLGITNNKDSILESEAPYGLTNKEFKNDFLMQLKHRFGKFIINSGLRVDYKRHGKLIPILLAGIDDASEGLIEILNLLYPGVGRQIELMDSLNNHRTITELSPRISLIYMLPRLNFKINYSKSFVDAPYLYRASGFQLLYLEKELAPETAQSFQLTIAGKDFVKNLSTEINFFCNRYTDLITNESILFVNWNVSMSGAEAVVSYKKNKLSLTANTILQRVTHFKTKEEHLSEIALSSGEDLPEKIYPNETHEHYIYNVPNVMANVTLGYSFWPWMRANANIYYTGKQYFCIKEGDILQGTEDQISKIPPVFLVNPSVCLTFGRLELNLDIHNIFNHSYSLGGRCQRPIQQKGLWLMAEVKYKF